MWKDVPRFDNYEASDTGYIRNKRTGKVLKNSVHKDGTGAPCVSLVRNNRLTVLETRFIVACTFLGVDIDARPKPKLDYIDGNKMNNAVANIRIKDATILQGEEWRPVSGWEDSYQVSSLGRIKRNARVDKYVRSDTQLEVTRLVSPLILKQTKSSDKEYWEINLIEGEKVGYYLVHRLVAEAFLPNPNKLPQVNHIDGNKNNNCVTNLEWCTSVDNIQHAIRTGLRTSSKGSDRTAKQVECIETGQLYSNIKEAASTLNVPYNYIAECVRTHRLCHGYHYRQIVKDRRIKCIDTGVIYESIAEIKDKFHFDPGDAIRRHACCHGLTFCYMRDLPEDEDAYLQDCRNRYSIWNNRRNNKEDNN